MTNRSLLAAVCLLLCLSAGPLVTSADEDMRPPDEDAVVIDIDPAGSDTVTLFFQTGPTYEPTERARERAEDADIPVIDVRTREVDAVQTVRINGNLVEGGPLYETTIETDLGRQTGVLQREVTSETIRGLTVEESTVIVDVPTGATVHPASQQSHSFGRERYGVDGRPWLSGDGITYGVGPIDLALLCGLLVGSFFAPYLFFRRWGRSIAGCDESLAERVHAVRETRSIAAFYGPVVPLVAALWFGAFAPIEFLTASILSASPSGTWWTVTLWFVAFTPFACVAWLGSTLAITPIYRRLVDAPYDRRRVLVTWSKSTVITVVWYWLVVVVLYSFSSRIVEYPAVGALLVGLLLVVRAGVTPALVVLANGIDSVTDEVAADIRELCDDAGIDVRGVYRLETGDSPQMNGHLTGLPGLYWIFVTDDLLEQCDSSQIRAVVAHEIGHLRGYHIPKRILFSVGYWFVGFTAYSVVPSIWLLLTAVAFYRFYALGWVTTAQEYAADAYAASATSPETVVSMLERLAQINIMKRDRGRQKDLANGHPSIQKRITQLRDDAAISGDDPDGDPGDA